MADVLEVQASLSLVLTRNGTNHYTQKHSTTAAAYTRHAGDRVVLAANMGAFSQVSLNDIGASNPGANLVVLSDRPIQIAVNTTAQYIEAEALFVLGASITALYFKNTDANNTATVEFLVTD